MHVHLLGCWLIACVRDTSVGACLVFVRYSIFGRSQGEQIAKQYGIPHAIQMPIDPVHADAVDASVPLVLQGTCGWLQSTGIDAHRCA